MKRERIEVKELVRIAKEYGEIVDKKNTAPKELLEELASTKALGINVPEDYGGVGGGLKLLVEVLEEVARESPSIAHILFVHSMSTDFIVKFGSEELKEEILPQIAKGKLLALSFTEPKSGTDLASIETTAEKVRDYYIVSGEKMFTTNAVYADAFIVLARTGKLEEKHKVLTLFFIERSEGVNVGDPIELVGFRGTGIARVRFRNVEVPTDKIIGGENRGFKPAITGLAISRIPFSAIAVGIAEGALEEAVRWALERRSFGKPIFENQAISFPLASLTARVEAVKTLVYKLAEEADSGKDVAVSASMAKLLSAELAVEAAKTAVQVLGGWGLLAESKVSRLYRDAKATEIAEGTNEVQKMIIARELAKKYSKQG